MGTVTEIGAVVCTLCFAARGAVVCTLCFGSEVVGLLVITGLKPGGGAKYIDWLVVSGANGCDDKDNECGSIANIVSISLDGGAGG